MYHRPVLLKESIEALNIVPSGVYVDATFGGGGHSKEILSHLNENGKLIGFDQDEAALANTLPDPRFSLMHHNFRYLRRFLRVGGVREVDGILADLGVSSHQFDEAERCFSFRFEADLDMRMNRESDLTAADIVNSYTAEQLQHIFGMYGEVRNARTLAQGIVESRGVRPIRTIADFLQIVEPLVRGEKHRYLAQVFQALRIEVNDEMGALQDFFKDALQVLKPNGRLVIISYHSLEDRITKNFIKHGTFGDEPEKDDFGNITRPFTIITKKPILPDAVEMKENSRSSSAKMRVGEKK